MSSVKNKQTKKIDGNNFFKEFKVSSLFIGQRVRHREKFKTQEEEKGV